MRHATIPLAIAFALLGVVAAQAASSEAVRRNNFGADLSKQGRYEEAATELQAAVQADPGYGVAYLNLGFAYDQLGRADEAIGAYEKAIALGSKSPAAFNNLSLLYVKKGKYDEAVQTIEQGLKLDPNNATLQKSLENAKAHQKVAQVRDARIADAQKQAEARPKDPRATYQVARVYASFGMTEEAFTWLGKAFDLGFNDAKFMREDPSVSSLRDDPRFARLLEGR